MKTISKADAIRAAAANDPSLTNHQIKEEVFRKYGLRIESNQIIGILGNQKTRNGPARSAALATAKRYLFAIGTYFDAVLFLRLVGKNNEGGK